jgi:hypothetical protein
LNQHYCGLAGSSLVKRELKMDYNLHGHPSCTNKDGDGWELEAGKHQTFQRLI